MKWIEIIKKSNALYNESPLWPFDERKNTVCTFVNHYSLLKLENDEISLIKFNYIFVDGKLLARQLATKLKTEIKRLSFDLTSVADLWFRSAVASNANIVIAGGSEAEILCFESWWIERYNKNNSDISITFINGYAEKLYENIIGAIDEDNFNFILLGLGSPLQEKMALSVSEKLSLLRLRGVTLTCGGFITQTAKTNIRDGFFYPKWIDKYDLRWLYRCWKQPFVLKRLLFKYPVSYFNVAFNKYK